VSRGTAVAVVLVVIVLAWVLMYVGYRRRVARQAGIASPAAIPAPMAKRVETDGVEVVYVSTTAADDWLDRVAAHGLGARSAAQVLVGREGVAVLRHGADDVFVPAADVRSVRRETMRAGKAVPGAGLLVWDWVLGDTLVSTAVHPRHDADRTALERGIRSLIPLGAPAAGAAPEAEPEEAP